MRFLVCSRVGNAKLGHNLIVVTSNVNVQRKTNERIRTMAKMTLDQFLKMDRNKGGRRGYLDNWKKRRSQQADIWLHTQSPLVSLWRHNLPRLFSRDDKVTGETTIEVWSNQWTCWEEDDLLVDQYRRDMNTGERLREPVVCPICKLTEHIRGLVEEGELDWTEELFHFEGTDPSKALTLHAGGIYNAFAANNLTPDQIGELKRSGIYVSKAWRENMMSKMSYLFVVADNDDLDKGPLITIEPRALGEKVRDVISDEMMSAEDEGNPITNPYAFRWMYDEKKSFSDKYRALKMARLEYTEAVERVIVDTPAPDLSGIVGRKDPRILRHQLEDAFIGDRVDIDWDKIFGPATERWEDEHSENNEASVSRVRSRSKPATRAVSTRKANKRVGRRKAAPKPPSFAPDEVDNDDDVIPF